MTNVVKSGAQMHNHTNGVFIRIPSVIPLDNRNAMSSSNAISQTVTGVSHTEFMDLR